MCVWTNKNVLAELMLRHKNEVTSFMVFRHILVKTPKRISSQLVTVYCTLGTNWQKTRNSSGTLKEKMRKTRERQTWSRYCRYYSNTSYHYGNTHRMYFRALWVVEVAMIVTEVFVIVTCSSYFLQVGYGNFPVGDKKFYWATFLDGLQRVLLIIDDFTLAYRAQLVSLFNCRTCFKSKTRYTEMWYLKFVWFFFFSGNTRAHFTEYWPTAPWYWAVSCEQWKQYRAGVHWNHSVSEDTIFPLQTKT